MHRRNLAVQAGLRAPGGGCAALCAALSPSILPAYEAVHRYDGAVIQRGRRDLLVPCTVQPRDVGIVAEVRRYKFLTAPQLRELWWPSSSMQAADRRLLKLFRAGYVDRFRPLSRRGSFPWTYQLGLEGHRLLQRAGLLGPHERFARREGRRARRAAVGWRDGRAGPASGCQGAHVPLTAEHEPVGG